MKVKNCNLIKPLKCKLDTPLVDAANILKQNKQRRIIVIDENEAPQGIISTTDMNNKVVAESRNPAELKAADIMTKPIYLLCDMEDDLSDIYQKMLDHKSFFVPTTKAGKLYAILTYGEIRRQMHEMIK